MGVIPFSTVTSIGYRKPSGISTWHFDVVPLRQDNDWDIFVHRVGSGFYYPAHGLHLTSRFPTVTLVHRETCTGVILLRKVRVSDLFEPVSPEFPSSLEEWRAVPYSVYANISRPVAFPNAVTFLKESGRLIYEDWYLDVDRLVLDPTLKLHSYEKNRLEKCPPRLQQRIDITVGSRRRKIDIMRPEIIDEDELADAVSRGELSQKEAAVATQEAEKIRWMIEAETGPFESGWAESLLDEASYF